jgi:phosphohistidine phosphatase
MSRTLHLLRHAKSSWSEAALGDRERGLNKRGQRDAPRMGQALSRLLQPLPVCASPARRAQATLEGVMQGWPELASLDHRCEEDLYTFSAGDLLDWLGDQSAEEDSLFLLGHNPALTELCNFLCGKTVIANLPTAGYVGLHLACESWSSLAGGVAVLDQQLFPRDLGYA